MVLACGFADVRPLNSPFAVGPVPGDLGGLPADRKLRGRALAKPQAKTISRPSYAVLTPDAPKSRRGGRRARLLRSGLISSQDVSVEGLGYGWLQVEDGGQPPCAASCASGH